MKSLIIINNEIINLNKKKSSPYYEIGDNYCAIIKDNTIIIGGDIDRIYIEGNTQTLKIVNARISVLIIKVSKMTIYLNNVHIKKYKCNNKEVREIKCIN